MKIKYFLNRIVNIYPALAFINILMNSCTIKQEHELISRIPNDTLRGVLLENIINSRRACLVFIGEHGLVTVANNEEDVIQLRNTKDGSLIISDITTGKGSNELLQYVVAGFDRSSNHLHFVSPVSKSYKRFLVTPQAIRLVEDLRFNRNFPGFNSVALFGDQYFIVSTIFSNHTFAVYDMNCHLLAEIPNNLLGDEIDYTREYHSSRIMVKEDKEAIVIGDIDLSYLSLYTFQESKMHKMWGQYLIEPKYYIRNKKFYFEKDHIDGISWIELTNERIYVLHDLRIYFDRNPQFHTFLLEFDYDGNFLHKYFLDYKIHSISFDYDGKTFYGVTEYPDVHIVKYQLP